MLRKAGISFENTKTWKHSRDPEFVAKKDRVLAHYHCPPADGRVICVDEFGPLNLLPRPAKGWFPSGRPRRLRATFHRTAGVRHMFAAHELGIVGCAPVAHLRHRRAVNSYSSRSWPAPWSDSSASLNTASGAPDRSTSRDSARPSPPSVRTRNDGSTARCPRAMTGRRYAAMPCLRHDRASRYTQGNSRLVHVKLHQYGVCFRVDLGLRRCRHRDRSSASRRSRSARLGTTKDARKIGRELFPVHRKATVWLSAPSKV